MKHRADVPAERTEWPSPAARRGLYVLTAIGAPLVTYLYTKGLIGADEVKLLGTWASILGGMAAIKVNLKAEAE